MDGIFRFDFKPTMHSIEKVEYTDTCVVKTLEDLKLLKDWWFCEDIHESPRLEKLVLERLREPGMNDVMNEAVAELSDTINKKIMKRLFEISGVPKSGFQTNVNLASPIRTKYVQPNFKKTVWKPR